MAVFSPRIGGCQGKRFRKGKNPSPPYLVFVQPEPETQPLFWPDSPVAKGALSLQSCRLWLIWVQEVMYFQNLHNAGLDNQYGGWRVKKYFEWVPWVSQHIYILGILVSHILRLVFGGQGGSKHHCKTQKSIGPCTSRHIEIWLSLNMQGKRPA